MSYSQILEAFVPISDYDKDKQILQPNGEVLG
jgi:hypothetical protein